MLLVQFSLFHRATSLTSYRKLGVPSELWLAQITLRISVDTLFYSKWTGPLSDKPVQTKVLDEPALVRLKSERDPNKLFQLFKANAHNKLVVENRFAFQDMVSRLAGARRFDYIEELLEHQKTLPQGRREGFIVRIIMLYGKAGMTKHAVNTFYDMHLYGCCRTVKSFNAAFKVLTLTRDLEAMESFLSDAVSKFGMTLDVFSVNIVIKTLCEMELLDKAYAMMMGMEKGGIRPDVITYTTLISAFYKSDKGEIGNGLWNRMVRRGCFPNLATFNVRIQFLVNKGRSWQANSLMGLMRYLRIYPDAITYNLVIKGFCRAGYLEMAKRVYSALHNEGFKPNTKIYQTMIHYLCKGGEFDLAYTMCKNSMKKNWYPNADTICQLLQGLQKDGKLERASFIVTLARKRVPSFPAEKLRVWHSILAISDLLNEQ